MSPLLLAAQLFLAAVPSAASLNGSGRLLLAQAERSPPPYANLSDPQLREEYDRLEDSRPGLGLPLGLMIPGAICGIFSVGLLLDSSSISRGLSVFFIVPAVALLTVGTVLLVVRIPQRQALGAQMDEVQSELDRRRALPPGQEVAPESAPVPLSVERLPPPPPLYVALTLARF